MLVLRKMNPEKVDRALNSMYRVWLSVAAVLSIEFAKTIALALSIADYMKQPVTRFVAPTIQLAVPDEYDKWVPVILGW
jgi:ubiquinone/menaquinone biosynthesis C-methylase UbiE